MTDYVWNGTTSIDSSVAANWTPSGVPGASDNVIFDATSVNPCTFNLSAVTDFTHEAPITVTFDVANLTISGVLIHDGEFDVDISRASVEIEFTGSASVLIEFKTEKTLWTDDTAKSKVTYKLSGSSNNIMFENGEYPIVEVNTTVSPHVPVAADNTYSEVDIYQLTFDTTNGQFLETSAVIYSSNPKDERNKIFRIRSIGTWSPLKFEGGKPIWIFYATSGGFELPLSGSNISSSTSFEGRLAQVRVIATALGQKIVIPPGPHYLEKLTVDVGVICICNRGVSDLLMTNRPTIDGAWQFVQIADGIYRSAKEDMILPITHGGTGEMDAQSAINALTQVSGATDEYVLTKDTTTGDAIWKAAAGGGGGSSTLAGLTDTTITSAEEPQILVYDDASSTWLNDTNDRLFIRVYNDTASTLSKGKVVYITGFQNANVAKVELAKADSSTTMPAIGIIWEDVSAGAEGYMVSFGKANGVAANFTAGDTLYVSPTTAGELTNTRPTSTSHLVQNVGILFKPDASNAVMKVTGVGRTNDIPNQFSVTGTITASSLITSGGTSSDFVKGDGSLDSSTYLTSFTETDPVFSAHPAFGVTVAGSGNISQGETAFTWGDHSLVGYLTTESDPVFSASQAALIINAGSGDVSQGDTAFGWGDHALAGYLTTETDSVVAAINGIVKSNGAVISAAVEDIDYQGVLAEGAFLDGDKTKLDGIPTGQYERYYFHSLSSTISASTTTQLTFGTTGAVLVPTYSVATDFSVPATNDRILINTDGLYQFTFTGFLAGISGGSTIDYRLTLSSTSSLTGDILSFRNRTVYIDRYTGSGVATVYLNALDEVFISVRVDGRSYQIGGLETSVSPAETRTFLDIRRHE